MSTTMHDVAKMAGVSVATVSHVLNGTRAVAEETRLRVGEAIKTLNYQPNISARALKTGSSQTVGFVVPDITNPFYAAVILRVEEILSKNSYSLLLANTNENLSQERTQLKMLTKHQVGGIIIASTGESITDIEDLIPDVPVLYFDRYLQGIPDSFVNIDAYQAYYDAIESLILQGHRRIGYVSGLSHLSTTKNRINAYKNAFANNHIPIDENCIENSDGSYEQTVDRTRKLLDYGCTAIVACNRKLTANIVCYLAGSGLSIGQDIEIVGTIESTMAIPFAHSIHCISRPIDEAAYFLANEIIRCIRERCHPNGFICNAVYIPKTLPGI